jgi:hypothetical protein
MEVLCRLRRPSGDEAAAPGCRPRGRSRGFQEDRHGVSILPFSHLSSITDSRGADHWSTPVQPVVRCGLMIRTDVSYHCQVTDGCRNCSPSKKESPSLRQLVTSAGPTHHRTPAKNSAKLNGKAVSFAPGPISYLNDRNEAEAAMAARDAQEAGIRRTGHMRRTVMEYLIIGG